MEDSLRLTDAFRRTLQLHLPSGREVLAGCQPQPVVGDDSLGFWRRVRLTASLHLTNLTNGKKKSILHLRE
jgi:hypothetical protein